MERDSSSKENCQQQPRRSLRLTKNQQAVLDALNQQAAALSAQELYSILREQQVIGLATIYRALEILRLRGVLQTRIGPNGESLYSPAARDQHYLTCLNCGQSLPLDYCPVQELDMQLKSSAPFKVYYHTLEFFGLCEPCSPETR